MKISWIVESGGMRFSRSTPEITVENKAAVLQLLSESLAEHMRNVEEYGDDPKLWPCNKWMAKEWATHAPASFKPNVESAEK